ncbi:MAG TPA: hypothetical protein VM715_20615 [Candidatus Acidoferrum sp.]|nr:hypothetical protein [Candidatus Acidoferrum sp.]
MDQHTVTHSKEVSRTNTGGIPQVLAHSPKDNVAVVVIEGLTAGTKAMGVVTENNTTFSVEVKDDIPIGHKVALKDLKKGDI